MRFRKSGVTHHVFLSSTMQLSALVHDAHHPGVPNAQLVKEGTTMAIRYKETSVAEQHSIDLCWDLLMQPKFKALRSTIYTTAGGLHRFRSLVINVSFLDGSCCLGTGGCFALDTCSIIHFSFLKK